MKSKHKGNFFWNREKQTMLEREQEEHRELEQKRQEVEKLTNDVVWFKRLMARITCVCRLRSLRGTGSFC